MSFKIFFVFILLSISILVEASELYTATSDLKIRSKPTISSKTLGIIKNGDTVKVLDTINADWFRIEHKDKIGYSSSKFLLKIEITKINTNQRTNNLFLKVLSIIFLVIVFIVILSISGKKYRWKGISAILSLLFGTIGLQKFYLGQTNKGIYSLIFCWTFIPTIIGIVDCIKLIFISNESFDKNYNDGKKRNIITKVFEKDKTVPKLYGTIIDRKTKTHNTTNNASIIDINKESYDLRIGKGENASKIIKDVPYWSHMYVYSYDDLQYASKQQKEFYYYFRNCFLNGKLIDIQENANYAFILYFDLLNGYENHRDIRLLERQFKLLGECCPKTKRYSLSSLTQLLREKGDSYSLSRLKELQVPSYQFEQGFSDYDPDAYKLGKKYKDKLGLNEQEVAWLNKFWNPSNVFLSIEGCCVNTIMLYLQVLKELNKKLNENGLSIAKEVDYFKEKILVIKGLSNSTQSYDITDLKSNVESDIYLAIFKKVENTVREVFGHKRKIGEFTYYEYNDEFEKRIGLKVNELVSVLKKYIAEPDISTQIELNAQNVNRWKDEFSKLESSFETSDISKFTCGISQLVDANQRNPNIENIFLETSKFLAKYDKVLSLKYYAKYIYFDLKSNKFDKRELSHTFQKSLFKTNEQINEFKTIIEELIGDSDIEKALNIIPNVYVLKRKRIILDKSEIEKAEQKHNGTVELLNEYLNSDVEKSNEPLAHIENSMADKFEITFSTNTKKESLVNSELNMNEIQEHLIKKISENSFMIHQAEVEKIAKQNGLFKNQLIDSINEKCLEILNGEALIEEDEGNYIIEESYFNKIVK